VQRAELRPSREPSWRAVATAVTAAPWGETEEGSESEELQERARRSQKKASQTRDKRSSSLPPTRPSSFLSLSSRPSQGLRGKVPDHRRGEALLSLSDDDIEGESEQEEIWEVKHKQRRQPQKPLQRSYPHPASRCGYFKDKVPAADTKSEEEDEEDSLLLAEPRPLASTAPPRYAKSAAGQRSPQRQPQSKEVGNDQQQKEEGDGSVTTAPSVAGGQGEQGKEAKQYNRLHKMYERITGIGNKGYTYAPTIRNK
jgi:hypothetical protein